MVHKANCNKFIYWCSRGYNDTIMISGVSYGGAAAVQLAIARSSIFKGAGSL
jgi:S-formylglutathione hydrolase FrmB